MEAQQTQAQITSSNRSIEQDQVCHYNIPQTMQPQYHDAQHSASHAIPPSVYPSSLSASTANFVQDSTCGFPREMSSSYPSGGVQSSNSTDVNPNNDFNATANSFQESIPLGRSSHSYDMPTNNSIASGVEEQPLARQSIHSPVLSPETQASKESYLPSNAQTQLQPIAQTHHVYADQQQPTNTQVPFPFSDNQAATNVDFEHVSQDINQNQQTGYLQPTPTIGIEPEYNGQPNVGSGRPQLSGTSSIFPPISSVVTPTNQQFEHPYISAPHPVHPSAQFCGRVPAPPISPGFRPPMPSVGVPFGLASGNPAIPSGPAMIVPPVYMGENNSGFVVPERPKKASVPSWLKEELMKKKAAAMASAASHCQTSEDQFHSNESGTGDQPLLKSELTENRSGDSGHTSDDEDDEDHEAARTAAINKEIKRVLTEVLMKVTNELFDEIAQEVLDEDDTNSQVKHAPYDALNANGPSRASTPPQPLSKPLSSGRVVVSVKNASDNVKVDSDDSSSSAAVGDVLGLGNYASDDENEVTQETKQEGSPSGIQENKWLPDDVDKEGQSSQHNLNGISYDHDRENVVEYTSSPHNHNEPAQSNGSSKSKNSNGEFCEGEFKDSKEREVKDKRVVKKDLKAGGYVQYDIENGTDQQNEKEKGKTRMKDLDKPRESKRMKNQDKENVNHGSVQQNREKGAEREKEKERDRKKDWDRPRESKRMRAQEKIKDKDKNMVEDRKKDWDRPRESKRMRAQEKIKDKDKNMVEDRRRSTDRLTHDERKGLDSRHEKEARRDHEKAKKATDKDNAIKKSDTARADKDERGRIRDSLNTGTDRKRSTSVSSRGRNSGKFDSNDSNKSSSSTEMPENVRRRRNRSSRHSLSPSPLRPKRRCVEIFDSFIKKYQFSMNLTTFFVVFIG
eukprot:TRINITY_DN559_c0_g1_i7.p1 TRINITY_DN559_c0_g1~~TRINITY_DN559_c0_g1_i7.p1  ORF type:complete len:948 (-),score=278.91 TRINITY_DN559_c0_g1_i7:1229-3946(-)